MKTTRITKIETNLDDLQFGFWDPETEEFIPLEGADPEILDKFGMNEHLHEMLAMFQDTLRDTLGRDLTDIWERMDKAGI